MFFRNKTTAKLSPSLALAVLITAAGAPSAQANDRDSDSIAVAARDLDLHTHTGAASLHHRVLVAAYKVCERVNPGAAFNSAAIGDCVQDAVHNASRQVDTLIAAAQGITQMASAAGPSR